jgi:hypothetical protein
MNTKAKKKSSLIEIVIVFTLVSALVAFYTPIGALGGTGTAVLPLI